MKVKCIQAVGFVHINLHPYNTVPEEEPGIIMEDSLERLDFHDKHVASSFAPRTEVGRGFVGAAETTMEAPFAPGDIAVEDSLEADGSSEELTAGTTSFSFGVRTAGTTASGNSDGGRRVEPVAGRGWYPAADARTHIAGAEEHGGAASEALADSLDAQGKGLMCSASPVVGRCKLDPSVKAPVFQNFDT